MTFVTKGNKLFYAASAVFNYPEWVIRVYVRFCRPLSVQVRYRANIFSSLKNTWQEFLCPFQKDSEGRWTFQRSVKYRLCLP